MNLSVIVFLGNDLECAQLYCSSEDINATAEKWTAKPEAKEVWLVPTQLFRKLIKAFKNDLPFLKKVLKNSDDAKRLK